MYSNSRKRKRPSTPDSTNSDSDDSGNSENAISPVAATVQPPMFSTSPPTENNIMTPQTAQPPSNLSSLSEEEELLEAISNMNVSNKKPTLRRSSTRGGKSKKRKTKYGGKKTKRKWSKKYKKSINCKKPKGFSQKQYCKYGRKTKKRRKTKKSKK